MKTIKLLSLFYFQAQETFFGTLKIGQNDPEIPNLEFEIHGFLEIKFSFQPNKLGQIYVE